MTTPSGFKSILMLTAVFTLLSISYAQAEDYKWLKSPKYESIFVFADFRDCDFIADKLNEAVKRTFSRSNIITTISNSLVFQAIDKSENPVNELLDDELISNNKIILHIYGKCIEYRSVYIYQFDIHFGVIDKRYSQALLYSTPRHSVMGVDTIRDIDRTFRKLMQNAVDDYLAVNKQ